MPARQKNTLETDRPSRYTDRNKRGAYLLVIGLSILIAELVLSIYASMTIKLLFNILAAGALLLIVFAPAWVERISGWLLSRNVTLTIEQECIVPVISQFGETRYYYDAIVHIQNKTGQEVDLGTYLGYFGTRAYQLGEASGLVHLPSGESDIVIDVPIDLSVRKTDIPAKPLHLFYRMAGSQYQGSLAVGHQVSRRLQELTGGVKPNRSRRNLSLA